jgi:uncharacterized protein DUF6268
LKKLLIALILFPCLAIAQDYVDLFKIGYGETFNNNFEGSSSSTRVKSLEADLTFPVVLNEKNALITGAAFTRNNLQLFPEAEFTTLYSTTLKLGLASTYNDKWSSTIVLLPKIASDYKNISGNDFYFGGFAVLKLQKKENLIYRFGFYGSSEAYGIFSTPIIGWYYLSPSGKFEMDMSLPIVADINYTCGSFTYGIDYFGIGRSFNITNTNTYVDMSSLEFASYLQYNAFNKSVLLRAKFGYSSNDYEVYTKGDEIDFGLSAFSFGDDRTQLNPSISGGLYLKFEAVYRFDITSEKDNSKK